MFLASVSPRKFVKGFFLGLVGVRGFLAKIPSHKDGILLVNTFSSLTLLKQLVSLSRREMRVQLVITITLGNQNA